MIYIIIIFLSEFLTQVARTTGIILDPTYTVKAARGMVLEMQRNPGRFKGNKVLFLHTGMEHANYVNRKQKIK